MYEPADFCHELEHLGVEFYVGVPDTVIENFCNYIYQNPPSGGHIIAANEGNAIGLAAGHYLATGRIPVVYMQNSGIGNAVNPLVSLADTEVFSIPMLLLVGWRGEPGVKDEPQHIKQGRISRDLFESMEIPCGIIGPDFEETQKELKRAFETMRERSGPYAIMVRNGCFAKVDRVKAGYPKPAMTREQAIKTIVECFDATTAFVASTGMGPRELYELRDAAGQGHERDLLNAGAMGHASQIAAGVAHAAPERKVVCLDGDGALFMHMGGLALIPTLGCNNLVHVLLNNGVHDSVGGQPDLGSRVDASALARDCGYAKVYRTDNHDELKDIMEKFHVGDGPIFVDVALARGYRSDLGRPKIPFQEAARQFRDFLCS